MRRSAGFSLIELMIALVAGLIVVGAVLSFTMSSLQSNTQLVQATRLTQELRNSIDYVSRELRRAGYDENYMGYYSQTTNAAVTPTSSRFALLLVENGTTNPATPINNACVVYAYDRQPGTAGGLPERANGEIRAIRRIVRDGVGVIEMAESAAGLTPTCAGASPVYTTYPPSCNAASGWCPLSDPRTVNITAFVVTTNRNFDLAATASTMPQSVRSLGVTITGNLIGQPDVVRSVMTRVRVRADCQNPAATPIVAGTPPNCNIAPVGT